MEMIPPFTNLATDSSHYLAHLGQQLLATWRQRESGQTLAAVLDEIIQQTHTLFPAQAILVSLYIYREDGLLYLERVDGELASVIKTRTSHPQGAAAVLVNRRTPLFVETIDQWPATFPPIADHLLSSGKIQAYVGLPLVIGLFGQEEVVGALLVSLRSPQRFDEARRRDLWIWAQQVALFVQNARVLRRRRREEEAFQAISASAGAGNPDEVATVIAQQICALTKSAFVTVLGHIPQDQRLESCGIALYDNTERTGVIQLDLRQRSINAHVVQTRLPYYAPELGEDPYYFLYPGWDEEMCAAYCVPLLIKQQVIGTIYLTSKERDGIALDDRNFMEKLAPHAAIALHHATLMQEERTQRVLQAQQVDFLTTVKRFQGDITDILSVYDQTRQIRLALDAIGVNTAGFFVATYNGDTGEIRLPKVRERGRRIEDEEKRPDTLYAPRRFGERRGLVEYVIRSGATLLVENFATWAHRDQIEWTEQQGLCCCLLVPLRHNGQLVGVIGLRGYDRPYLFSPREQALLEATADDIATVLENAQKYDAIMDELRTKNVELQQRVQALRAVNEFQRAISNIDIREEEEIGGADIVDISPSDGALSLEERELQNIYDNALEAMREVGMDTANMYIALYHEETQIITVPLIYEEQQRVTGAGRPAYHTRRRGDYPHLIDWIIEHRESLLFESRQALLAWAAACAEPLELPERSHSWLGAPLLSRNKLLGVIVVRDFEREYIFNQGHQQLLEMLANQAAIVIDNARLYERSRRTISQLQALYGAGQRISAAGFALDDVLHTILEQATKVTGAYFATLWLLNGNGLKLVATWPPEQRALVEKKQPILPLDQKSVITAAFHRNRYLLVPDVTQIDYFLDVAGETGCELAVVLRRGSNGRATPMGVLNLEHREVNGLTKADHAGILVGLANLAALAIRNVEQAQELEEARDYAIASEAVAWFGITAADRQHTLAQKIGSLRYCTDTLQTWTHLHGLAGDECIEGIVVDLNSIADDIQAIKSTASSAIPTEMPTVVDRELRRTVQRWCDAYNQEEEAAIQCQFDLQCDRLKIQVPPNILRIAAEKIVHNAFKAMGNEGVLTVRSQCINGQIAIDMEDTGPGIPDFALPHFLKRPIQRPPGAPGQGTGMGAHIARIIARRYRGDLTLLETSAAGAKLRLTFPVDET